MQNKLSIITINLNNAGGLRKTLESVFSQQEVYYEFIVIDGKSTDQSVDILKEYSNKFKSNINTSFNWLSEIDTGVYNAMNKGIKLAKGEYLLFLNSGDYLVNENVLKDVFSEYRSADFLCGKCNISDKGKVVHTANPPENHTFLAYFKDSLNHQSTFIRKDTFDRFGLYREDFKYNSDWEFWIRTIILNNCSTQKLNVVVCDYNLDGISSKENNTSQYKKEIEEVFSHPLLQKFVPDYKYWESQYEEMRLFNWVKRKKLLYVPLKMIYNIARWVVSLKW